MNRKHKHTISPKAVSTHEIKNGLDLVKYLHRNENNADLKMRLAMLGDVLNRLSHTEQRGYSQGGVKRL